MITRVIKGVKCRMVKTGEVIKSGDMFADGVKIRHGDPACGKKESDEDQHSYLRLYRPIKRATKPKPKSKASGIEAMVCADIAERQKKGIAKYGTTVADNPLTDLQWLRHAYEESLDLPIYLRKLIANMEAKGK